MPALRRFFVPAWRPVAWSGAPLAAAGGAPLSSGGAQALLTDAVRLESRERKRLGLTHDDHPVVPAVKIARLGVALPMQRGSGIGTALVRFAYFRAVAVADSVGARLLTVDAYPESISFYEKLGFVYNRASDYRERRNPSMRLDLVARTLPDWL